MFISQNNMVLELDSFDDNNNNKNNNDNIKIHAMVIMIIT